MNKVAFVTGASRGIGKACAVHLARAGFDVAVSSRTLVEGESREYSSTLAVSDTRPLPGSLSSTAELVAKEGRRAMVVAADLLDRVSVGIAAATVEERWGRIDVLVNNGRYVGPGHMDHFRDIPLSILEMHLEANVMAPLILTRYVLPGMISRGNGLVVNMTSSVAWRDPERPAGQGGWGVGYGFSKAALHRVAGVLAQELKGTGVACVNLEPGFTRTERLQQNMSELGFDPDKAAPPDVVGAAAAWLATHPTIEELSGQTVHAREVCREHDLVPSWAG